MESDLQQGDDGWGGTYQSQPPKVKNLIPMLVPEAKHVPVCMMGRQDVYLLPVDAHRQLLDEKIEGEQDEVRTQGAAAPGLTKSKKVKADTDFNQIVQNDASSPPQEEQPQEPVNMKNEELKP